MALCICFVGVHVFFYVYCCPTRFLCVCCLCRLTVTWRVIPVEQEYLTLREHLMFSGVRVAYVFFLHFMCSVL